MVHEQKFYMKEVIVIVMFENNKEIESTQSKQEIFKEIKDVLNVEDLCDILDIGLSSAYKLVRENKIKYIKIGRAYKIPKCYLIDFILDYSKTEEEKNS